MKQLLDFFTDFFPALKDTVLEPYIPALKARLEARIGDVNHGDLPGWLTALDQLPAELAQSLDLDTGCLHIGNPDELSAEARTELEANLRALMPWRKGPYELFGTHIDTEWRSDFKWDRVAPHLSDLTNRTVLDIGCGNGYHCWRMHAAGAKRVVGVDPSWKFLVQFQAIKRCLGERPVDLLPLGIEDLPSPMPVFDTVFSMGVFYHRRSPMDHLLELKSFLRPGGELVLETLIVDGDEHQVLVPGERYAQMRNVWFLPSAAALKQWLERMGFVNVRCVDINQTSTDEQRRTDWMDYHSLAEFLDPGNPELTLEGYPAPKRAIMIANTPF